MSHSYASSSSVVMRLATGLSFTVAALVACSDDPAGPGPNGELPRSSALVSAPEAGVQPIAGAGVAGIAYVSMPPGTEPDGVSVTVQDGRDGPSVSVAMVQGGFDPISVVAQPGDTLLITVHRQSGGAVQKIALVPIKSRPVVVRTSPPDRKTDVPLNSIIRIIFSQPMDAASLVDALHLKLDGAEVAGEVTISPVGEAILSASFAPLNPLVAQTTYLFDVATTALGQNGESLAVSAQVSFTTGGAATKVAAVSISPSRLLIMAGVQWQMFAQPVDESGNPLSVSCTFSTSLSGVAAISTGGLLSALTPGVALIHATCDGITGEDTVTVIPAVALAGRLAFTGGSGGIDVVNLDGSGLRALTPGYSLTGGYYDYGAEWSPDGNRVAFARYDGFYGAAIHVVGADGINLRSLSPPGSYDADPTWSPDGSRIAFENRADNQSGGHIFVMNADGSNRIQLTSNLQPNWQPAWSPNGTQIAYTTFAESDAGSQVGIYLINADGTGRTRLTPDSVPGMEAAWSPDGKQVAFTAYAGAGTELFIINADGSGLVQLTTGLGGAGLPAWSPDGEMIAFNVFSGCDPWVVGLCPPNPIILANFWVARLSDGKFFPLLIRTPVQNVSLLNVSWK
jgi:Tol biopolymer transport system component